MKSSSYDSVYSKSNGHDLEFSLENNAKKETTQNRSITNEVRLSKARMSTSFSILTRTKSFASERFLLRLGLFQFKRRRLRIVTRKQHKKRRQHKIEGSLTGIPFWKSMLLTSSLILTPTTSFASDVYLLRLGLFQFKRRRLRILIRNNTV